MRTRRFDCLRCADVACFVQIGMGLSHFEIVELFGLEEPDGEANENEHQRQKEDVNSEKELNLERFLEHEDADEEQEDPFPDVVLQKGENNEGRRNSELCQCQQDSRKEEVNSQKDAFDVSWVECVGEYTENENQEACGDQNDADGLLSLNEN